MATEYLTTVLVVSNPSNAFLGIAAGGSSEHLTETLSDSLFQELGRARSPRQYGTGHLKLEIYKFRREEAICTGEQKQRAHRLLREIKVTVQV